MADPELDTGVEARLRGLDVSDLSARNAPKTQRHHREGGDPRQVPINLEPSSRSSMTNDEPQALAADLA